jgi:L-fuconolactonase
MQTKIIDTHIHIWNFEKAQYPWLDNNDTILNRTYRIEEIEPERNQVGVTEGVLVQASNNLEDTDWMLQNAAEVEWIKGVVGWLPLQDPVQTKQLLDQTYLSNPYFKGIRHLIHDEADPKWLLQSSVIESLQIVASNHLTFDVVGILPQHIETALKVSALVPNLRMVFDHLNQPPIASKEQFGSWGEWMKLAAQQPQFYAKVSGLGTTTNNGTNWSPNDLSPYFNFILEHFGVDRIMCGGDWPVSLLAGTYAQSWEKYKELITNALDKVSQEKVFYSNAKQFYNL